MTLVYNLVVDANVYGMDSMNKLGARGERSNPAEELDKLKGELSVLETRLAEARTKEQEAKEMERSGAISRTEYVRLRNDTHHINAELDEKRIKIMHAEYLIRAAEAKTRGQMEMERLEGEMSESREHLRQLDEIQRRLDDI